MYSAFKPYSSLRPGIILEAHKMTNSRRWGIETENIANCYTGYSCYLMEWSHILVIKDRHVFIFLLHAEVTVIFHF
jgi:hypothetical protein